MSGINRINVTVPSGTSAQLVLVRDESISKLLAALGVAGGDPWHYVDTSPLAAWAYLFVTYAFSNGILTVATVSCSGITNPPSGSNLVGVADPGPGTVYTWTAVGALPIIRTSGGGGGVSPPAGNNNYYVWNIAGNSSTAVADFTAAVTAVNSGVPGNTVRQGFKYVDSVSGAWQVWWIAYGAGSSEFAASSASILANNNILYMVTCAGTPHPLVGSSQPAVTMPAFTQTFTTISAPLSFGPQR